jgi:4-amino-4-deoxy-L-arabinose transferase-like glycosyltransferase
LKKVLQHETIILLPLLLIYCLYVIIKEKPGLSLDEPTYLLYARNLINGFYVPKGSTFLWAGPGYPIILAVLEKFDLTGIYQKLLNAIFLYGSLLCMYYSVRLFTRKSCALILASLCGFYYPFYLMLPYRMTEVFVIFLISLIVLYVNKWSEEPSKITYKVVLILVIAWLMLTKIIFGYVIAGLLILFIIAFLLKQNNTYLKLIFILFLSIITISPYLYYTYQLTGKYFYWGTSGGLTLYWMSSPYAEEYGDFINFFYEPSNDPNKNQLFRMRHEENIKMAIGEISLFQALKYEELPAKLGVVQDQQFKKMAIMNIKAHPIKYIKNILSNSMRMIFNFPYSYRENRLNLKLIICNSILLLFVFITSLKHLRKNENINNADLFLLSFTLIYLGGSVLLSATPRQFYIVSPILLYFIGKYSCIQLSYFRK